jgi:hypothetical protein
LATYRDKKVVGVFVRFRAPLLCEDQALLSRDIALRQKNVRLTRYKRKARLNSVQYRATVEALRVQIATLVHDNNLDLGRIRPPALKTPSRRKPTTSAAEERLCVRLRMGFGPQRWNNLASPWLKPSFLTFYSFCNRYIMLW